MSKGKLPTKKKIADEVTEDIIASNEAPVPTDVVEEAVAIELAEYVDPDDFIYEVQAGKKYSGFSAEEAVLFAEVMIGKVDKIVISKQK